MLFYRDLLPRKLLPVDDEQVTLGRNKVFRENDQILAFAIG
jgi:hypothetical protein